MKSSPFWAQNVAETLPEASQVRVPVDFADKLTNSIEMRPRVWSKHTAQMAPKMHGRAAMCAKKRPGSARTASCASDGSRPGLDAVAWCTCMYATAGRRDGDALRSPAEHEVCAIAHIDCLTHFRRPPGDKIHRKCTIGCAHTVEMCNLVVQHA